MFYYYAIGQKERKNGGRKISIGKKGIEVVESVTEGLRYKGQGLGNLR